jgi:hypothetical protein
MRRLVREELFSIATKFILSKLLESIPMFVTLVVFYVLQLLCDISLNFFVTYMKP